MGLELLRIESHNEIFEPRRVSVFRWLIVQVCIVLVVTESFGQSVLKVYIPLVWFFFRI